MAVRNASVPPYGVVIVADAHHRAAVAAGARGASEPSTHAYGERQHSVRDLAGHLWTFTASVADVVPESWGGTTVTPW